MDKLKLISIIVPAYNRADEINDFLASFSVQSLKKFEIIIVDDGSEDNLKEIVEKYNSLLNLQYFYQENQGPGAARNKGMEEANGDIFVFIDSDCTASENYIENLQKHLQENDFDAFGGPDTCHKSFSPFLKAINYSMTSFIGTGGTRGSKGKQLAKYYPRSFNMGIKRKVYEKIGGMNELRHGQDMDFSNRIYKAGFKIKFLPDVFVYHKRRTNLKRFFKQIFNWGVTRINLGKIDKNMLKLVHCLPTFVILIFLLTLFFSFWFPLIRYLFLFEIALIVFVIGFAFVQSTLKYKSGIVGLLSTVTLSTQVVAYGLGLLYGFIKSIFTKKGVFITGFTKKYYK
ncbi:MAG: glycosyltransferase [Candidatus Cloacimonadota bacterium]|nr:glycosyltransferase [Candidatus Cloacimonadota bacterium]